MSQTTIAMIRAGIEVADSPSLTITEDSTPVVICSYTPEAGEAGLIEVRVTAQDAEGNLLAYHMEVSYKDATPGTVVNHYALNQTSGSVSLTTDETSIVVEATGIDGTMNWAAKYKVIPVLQIVEETET